MLYASQSSVRSFPAADFPRKKHASNPLKTSPTVSFGRKPTAEEAVEMRKTISEALQILNKRLKLIIHGPNIPSEAAQNVGVGSPATKGAEKLWKFITGHGFSGVQEGPMGKLMLYDPSPYLCSSTSGNELFIDAFELAEKKWGEIVSKDSLKRVVLNNKQDFRPDINPDHKREVSRAKQFLRLHQTDLEKDLKNFREKGIFPPQFKDIPPEGIEKKLLSDLSTIKSDLQKGSDFEYLKGKNLSELCNYEPYTKKDCDFNHARLNYLGKFPSDSFLEGDYHYLHTEFKGVLQEAYENFINKKVELPQLHKEFSEFKSANNKWLERDSLYEMLTKEHGNDYYMNWHSAENGNIDRDLFKIIDNANSPDFQKAINRKSELESKYQKDIDNYKFNQFVFDKQMVDAKQRANKLGITRMGDAQIVFSHMDYWAHPDLFHNNEIGWSRKLPHPAKLFNQDGSFGPVGQMIYDKYSKILKYYDGMRLDSAPRLFDVVTERNGNKISEIPDEYRKTYQKTYDKIIRKVLDDHGLWDAQKGQYKNVAAEALADFPAEYPSQRAFDKNVLKGIPSIYQPLWGQDVNLASPSHVMLLTSHDQNPFRMLINNQEEKISQYRKGALNWSEDKSMQSQKHTEYLDYLADYTGFSRQGMYIDNAQFTKAKFAEMFLSPAEEVHICYDDMFGIDRPHAWHPRLEDNFEDIYHLNAENDKALNLPEILEKAVDKRQGKSDLSQRLRKFSEILKEKTPIEQIEGEDKYYMAQNLEKQFAEGTPFSLKKDELLPQREIEKTSTSADQTITAQVMEQNLQDNVTRQVKPEIITDNTNKQPEITAKKDVEPVTEQKPIIQKEEATSLDNRQIEQIERNKETSKTHETYKKSNNEKESVKAPATSVETTGSSDIQTPAAQKNDKKKNGIKLGLGIAGGIAAIGSGAVLWRKQQQKQSPAKTGASRTPDAQTKLESKQQNPFATKP